MTDQTEESRPMRLAEINSVAVRREDSKAVNGQLWTTVELGLDFGTIDFSAPLVVFQHTCGWGEGAPKFYRQTRDDIRFVPA